MKEVTDRWQEPREGLPLAPDHASETMLALARIWSRLCDPVVVPLRRLGDIQLHPDQITMIDDAAPVLTEGMAWFKLVRATEHAWLGVTLDACHALIRAVLGSAPPLLIRPLGSAERGMMAAFVVFALDTLGLVRCITVVPDEGQPSPQGHTVLLAGTIRGSAGIHGRGHFMGPLSWLSEGGWDDSVTTQMAGPSVEGFLELGRTVVSEAELRAATSGDAISFDGTPTLLPGAAWPVNLLVGRSYASARLDSVNRLSLVGSWAQINADQAAPQDKGACWKSAEPKPSETTESGDPSLEVVAELGRISLLGDELAGLAKGESLMLGPRPSDLIQLRVRGRLWATGTLVALGEQLGVRIVRLGG